MQPENFEGLILRLATDSDLTDNLFELFPASTNKEATRIAIQSRLQNPNIFTHIIAENPETLQIVAFGSAYVEQKFIRQGGKAGHLENILLQDPSNQALIQKIIHHLKAFCQNNDAYKIITAPDAALVEPLQASGLEIRGIHMELVLG